MVLSFAFLVALSISTCHRQQKSFLHIYCQNPSAFTLHLLWKKHSLHQAPKLLQHPPPLAAEVPLAQFRTRYRVSGSSCREAQLQSTVARRPPTAFRRGTVTQENQQAVARDTHLHTHTGEPARQARDTHLQLARTVYTIHPSLGRAG